MPKRKKRILSFCEEVTHDRLKTATDHWKAKVFSKLRLADVFEIEKSGITNEEYRFALQAHFDFVVSNQKNDALFAVEFDGSSHEISPQKERDTIKNRICEEFNLPLLRINGDHVFREYRDMTVLSWIVEYWFLNQDILEAYAHGKISEGEYLDPLSVLALPNHPDVLFPMWLANGIRRKIYLLHEARRCKDITPSDFVGKDSAGNFHAIAWLALNDTSGVVATTAMRAQQFPIESTVLEEILVFEVHQKLLDCLNGKATPVPLSVIEAKVRALWKSLRLLHAGGSGELFSAIHNAERRTSLRA